MSNIRLMFYLKFLHPMNFIPSDMIQPYANIVKSDFYGRKVLVPMP